MGLPQSYWENAYPCSYVTGALGPSASTVVVSSISGKKFRVLAMHIEAGTAGIISVKSTSGSMIASSVYCASGVPQHFSYCPVGWGETGTSEEIIIDTDATAVISYTIVYCKV